MGAIWREMRDAVRSLAANPGFTVTVVAILALGIGANSTMFSVLNAVVLRPIPWENPERLVDLSEVNPRQGGYEMAPSTANYNDWRLQSRVLECMAAFRFVHFNLADTHADPERVPGMRVSAEFFPLIGVKAALGRTFLTEDEQPGRDHVVLLSRGFWRRRYGADPGIVGRTVMLEGESYTVAGVLQEFPMFRVLNRALDIYTPLALPSAALRREDHSISVYARLRPGISVARAQSEMDTIARRLGAAYPKTNTDWTVKVIPLTEYFARRRRAMLEFLLAAAGFVLLIACANIASLTLARSVSSQKDLAIRMALGAGRLRIVRRLLAESLILALAGGGLGALLAVGGAAFLDRTVSTFELNRMSGFRVDLAVLGLTVGISLAASALFGVGPAIRSSKFDVSTLLAHASGRGSTGRREAGNLLIVSEVALATMLLIGAAVAARGTLRLLRMDRGLDPHNVLTAQLWMPASRYATGAAERHFMDEVLARLRALPGVVGASVANYPPLGILGTAVDFEIEGRPAPAPGEAMTARFRVIDPEFFRTMRVPLVKGRAFETGDADETRGVVIVSEAFARRFFANEDALGKRVRPHFPGGDAFWYPQSANVPLRIVGIARDIRDREMAGDLPQMYLPYAQNPSRIMHLLVRTQGAPLDWAAAVRGAILEVDRDLPLFDVKTLEEVTAETFSAQSTFGAMLIAAAGLALLLAATGIYALLAWSVSRRTRELGIRMAVGAAPADVVRMVLRQALQPAMAGVIIGAGGALALHALLRAQIEAAQGFDPIAFALPAVVLALVSMAAAIPPAFRAVHVDPIAALRME
jgi:putative ABC transport system permease protein